jgi:hypothetical protein
MSDNAVKPLQRRPCRTYDARLKRSGVPTLCYRDHGRPFKAKAEGQLYLAPSEEKALEKYLKLIADLGNPV